MTKYKSYRIINGKPKWIISDKNGSIVNKEPNKEDLKNLEEYKKIKQYTDEELLNYPRKYYEKYGRVPTGIDFDNHREYPNRKTYDRRFGSWQKALKLVELDIESMIKNGIVKTNDQKARLAEMIVKHHFENRPIDLAGENHNSSCDGICPNGKTYDVKSSWSCNGTNYSFNIRNKYKEKIEIYYLLGFNDNYTKLEYGWRVPAKISKREHLVVGSNYNYEFNIDNMKKYDITEKLKDVFENMIK